MAGGGEVEARGGEEEEIGGGRKGLQGSVAEGEAPKG
jgi:hypothetical protein